MFRRSDICTAVLLPILGSVMGCSGPAHQFAEVEGKVTLNGAPLAGVIVKFYPDSEGLTQLPIGTGTTDEAGMYRLKVSEAQPGALVGPNIAVVRWPVRDRAAPPPVPDVLIPLKYTQVSEKALRFEVKPGPVQTLDLILLDD